MTTIAVRLYNAKLGDIRRYENTTSNRFLALVTARVVEINRQGRALTSSLASGQARFTFAQTRFRLEVELQRPSSTDVLVRARPNRAPALDMPVRHALDDEAVRATILWVHQAIRVVADARGIRLEAETPLHPRLSFGPDPDGADMAIWVDVAFLDLSRFIDHVIHALPVGNWIRARLRSASIRTIETVPNGAARFSPVTVIPFEYTVGRPGVWLVAVPPLETPPGGGALQLGVFLFFRPNFGEYLGLEDITLDRTSGYRFIDEPLRGYPWFVGPSQTNFGAPADRDAVFFWSYPETGWAKQVARAHEDLRERGRSAPLFVQPLPSGTDFGDAEDPTRVSQVLSSLLRAVGSTRATSALSVPLGDHVARLALGAFSAGGPSLFSLFESLRPGRTLSVDELYLFDPVGFAGALPGVRQWIRSGAGRKLRMIGGNYLNAMHREAGALRSLPAGNDATAWPALGSDRASPFREAFMNPVHRTGATVAQALEEVPSGFVPGSVGRQSRSSATRHQWTVCGGEGTDHPELRQQGFTGFLHRCLRESGF